MRSLHVSEMIILQQCGRRWQHAYADRRVPLVPHERLTRGTRMHRFLAAWWSGETDPVGPETPIEFAMAIGYARRWTRPHLVGVKVNVPFHVEIGGVPVEGTFDAVGIDPADDRPTIVESKTHRGQITPGNTYWKERIACDPQVSMYQAAIPNSKVLYDVLRVPELEQLEATPEEKRKYTKPTKAEPTPRLYANQRLERETDGQFIDRLLAAIAEEPDAYYQRQTLVRLDADRDAFAEDVRLVSLSRSVPQPRNTKACFDWGECEYFGVCFEGQDLMGPRFTDRED